MSEIKNNLEQVCVIVYDRHGMVDEIYLDSKENAAKRCLIHNLAHFLDSKSSEEDKQIAVKLEKFVKDNNWDEAFKLWEDERLDEREFHRPSHFYSFTDKPDIKSLWIYKG